MSAPAAPTRRSGIALGRPQVPAAVAPVAVALALAATGLTDDEQDLFDTLRTRIIDAKPELDKRDLYYRGEQKLTSLGISLPPELANADIRTVMGWPRIGTDAPHERLGVDGFRYPDALDADDELWQLWQANNLDLESDLAHLDALVFGRAFVVVGTREDDEDTPLVSVESPLSMAALWDARRRHPSAALQLYEVDDEQFAALYLPDQTVTLAQDDDRSAWTVVDRDEHRLGWPPVMMMANRARTHDRQGCSEITPELMALTDMGCRTLFDLEVAREFYAVPQRYVLGATEETFRDENGNSKSVWETIRGRVLGLPAIGESDTGQPVLPQVGQFVPYSPSAFTEVLNQYAERVASITGLPPSYLGRSTDQPASADAIRMSTDRLVQKVRLKQKAFEQAWEGALRMALALRNGGTIPDGAQEIETIWRNPEVPMVAQMTDAMQKQVAAGIVPPTSDPVLERLGWTALERKRMERDRGRLAGSQALEAITRRGLTSGPPTTPENAAADAVAATVQRGGLGVPQGSTTPQFQPPQQ